jgi:hypothetical protein
VTREKSDKISNKGALLRGDFDLLLSARFDIELLMSEMFSFGEDGSSDFISAFASFLTSAFSS